MISRARKATTAGMALSALLLFQAVPALALSLNKGPRRPPDLLPELPPLQPSFWERHGLLVVLGSVLLLAAAVFGFWRLRRPKVAATPRPEDEARQALRALAGKPEDPSLAVETARRLRRLTLILLGAGGAERTADELDAMLKREPGVDAELARELSALLHDCEARAFAAVPPPGAPGLVVRALSLADRLESALRPPAPTPGQPPSAAP